MTTLPDITALGPAGLREALAQLGEPRFRADQLVRWIYQRGVRDFSAMTDLPASLRDALSSQFSLGAPTVLARQVSSDGTRKYLVGFADGVEVECVGLPSGDRLTVCFSTQAGCAMGCAFCATGRAGLVRDLSPGEIVDQVRVVAEDFGQRVSNAVAMGQGEPFANYDALLDALRIMNAEHGLGIGARHLTVSTCGLLPGVRRFATGSEQFTLAVSLHSAVQATRDRLMPGLRSYPVAALRRTLADYAEATGRRPTLEYALVGGVNDTDRELEALVRFCSGLLCHVNLIPVNPVVGSAMSRPAPDAARRFRIALGRANIEASVRAERGTDIDAACGQLRQRASGADDRP